MSQGKQYTRESDGLRFKPGSMNTVKAADQLAENEYCFLQNVRGYLQDRITGRATLGDPLKGYDNQTATEKNGTAISVGFGVDVPWTNPANIFSNIDYTSCAWGTFPHSSETLQASGLGFNVPVDAVITGIQLSFKTFPLGGFPQLTLGLLQNSAAVGSTLFLSVDLTGGRINTFGGNGELFGYPWTPALINGLNGLGFYFIGQLPPISSGGGGGSSAAVELNSLVATVYYAVPDRLISVPVPIHSIRRLNDSTPAGPPSGYELIVGGGTTLWASASQVAVGLSGNPLSLVPFRPNASVAPWMYVGDSSQDVTIEQNLVDFHCKGMLKVRSDGLTYKMGIAEPAAPPIVGTADTISSGTASLLPTMFPWTNAGGVNASYNYGQRLAGSDGTNPVIISPPGGLVYGSTVKVTVTATGPTTINGNAGASPTTAQANSNTFPGYYVYPPPKLSTSMVIGAFTDGVGNVVAGSAATPNIINIGSGATYTVPVGATQFQIGVDSSSNTFNANSGAPFAITWVVNSSAISDKIITLGQVTAYSWGDSPHSGPVSAYIWKNVGDSGSGIVRTIGTAGATTQNNSWELDSSPQDGSVLVSWNTVDATGTVTGTVPLYSVSLEPPGVTQDFNNFNSCIVGSIFVPAGGIYAFSLQYKDQILFGIGGGATLSGNVTTTSSWHAPVTQTGPFTGINGQKLAVASGVPLLYVGRNDGSTATNTFQISTFNVSFPAGGAYQVEVDLVYWDKTGRCMYMKAANPGSSPATIPTTPVGTRTNISYAYKYRSSKTGAVSNPSQVSALSVTPVLGNTLQSAWSPDPQVDLVDFYRQDTGLSDYTYVCTGPNDGKGGFINGVLYNTLISDTLSDIAAAANPVMQLDDFEPFPSIDLPRSGVVTISGGQINWNSGDKFNIRWLPGTLILIGGAGTAPSQAAYTLVSRPTSATTMTIPEVPDGANVPYNIAEPILAAQPLPSLWGPTDNTAYMFACYDPLRPGTLYFTKGNNPDSAPDTNQIEVTSPSEPLMNGCITNGIGMVFSSERAWLIFPTFATALATVSGVEGTVFNLEESISNRGLYIRTCLCTEGGINVFFRAKDGIYVSQGGRGSGSITDTQIYNLFPHEGEIPQPVVIAGQTIYPPDDTQPNSQKLSFSTGYLYYDYLNTLNTPCTLVFDVAAKGWSVDVYQPTVTVHALEEGPTANDTLTGVSNGTVRRLTGTGTEAVNSIVATRPINAGEARALKTLGDIFIKATVANGESVTIEPYQDRYATLLNTGTLVGDGTLKGYIVDTPTNGTGKILTDIEMLLSWTTTDETILELWQPDFTPLPETTQDRPTDWDDGGSPGNKFVQGLYLECNTFGATKNFAVQRSDDGALFTPVECPFSQNGQDIRTFTFSPPFTAHMIRIVTTDGVPWMIGPAGGWSYSAITQPYPESSTTWTTEASSFSKYGLYGYIHCYQINLAYVSSTPVLLTMNTDEGAFTLTYPAGGGLNSPAKILLKMPRNKWKICSFTITSSTAFNLWKDLTEVWLKSWGSTGEYIKVDPFGGETGQGATI